MTCEDFIRNYTTGSLIRRMRACLHARRCNQCASTRDWLVRVSSELSAPAELGARHQRWWQQACTAERPEPARQGMCGFQWSMAGGLALAATIVIGVLLSKPRQELPNEQNIASNLRPSHASVVTISLQVPRAQIVEFEQGLNRIGNDLDRLADEATRLEIRGALSDLAAMYPPLVTPDST